jgi:hypothetical protein
VVEVLDQRLVEAPDMPWCTLAARVQLPELGDVLVIATTFAWRLDAEAARERQALALTDLDARQRCALPTIVAGDLNAGPDAASVRFLTGLQSLAGRSVHYHDAWAVAGDGPGHTWTTANPLATRRSTPSYDNPDITVVWTTSSSGRGMPTRLPAPSSARQRSSLRVPKTGGRSATTTASAPTSTSSSTATDEALKRAGSRDVVARAKLAEATVAAGMNLDEVAGRRAGPKAAGPPITTTRITHPPPGCRCSSTSSRWIRHGGAERVVGTPSPGCPRP